MAVRAEHEAGASFTQTDSNARDNFRLAVLNGALFTLVDSLVSPTMVLAWFVSRLGGPNVLVGLVSALFTACWFLPQMLVAGRIQYQRRVKSWNRRTGLVRIACMSLLALASFTLADYPALLLAAFFSLLCIYALAAGAANVPWLEIVGKIIPMHRRGTFFSLRGFWGGLLALAASSLITALLSERLMGAPFPYNFALVFLLAAAIIALAVRVWGSVREPGGQAGASLLSPAAVFRHGMEALRNDSAYRASTIARTLLGMAAIADPFYAVYALNVLGAPSEMLGLYLAALTGSGLLGNLGWGLLADRVGTRNLLGPAALCVACVPLAALAIPLLAGILTPHALQMAFALVFVLSGLAGAGGRVIHVNMLLEIAPPRDRATYVSFSNTWAGLVMVLPLPGGIVVDAFGFTALFVVVVGLGGLATLAGMRAKEHGVAPERISTPLSQ